MRKILLSIMVLVFFSVSTLAFSSKKNERRGFILGGGLGASWMSWSQTIDNGFPEPKRYNENIFPLTTDIRIGGGFTSNKLMLYYWNKFNWLSVEGLDGNQLSWNGIHAIGVSYYFKSSSPALYVNGGLGVSSWNVLAFSEESEQAYGVGVLGGIGYEFERHRSVEVTFMSTSQAEKSQGVTTTTTTFVVTLCLIGIAY